MNNDEIKEIIYDGLLGGCCGIIIYLLLEGENMDVEILKYVLSGIGGAVVTGIFQRWSYVKSNTDALKKFSSQLGLNDNKSIRVELAEKYDSINESLGVKKHEAASLTKQHEQMQNVILQSYSEIRGRYEAEDKAYRAFTNQQRDLKQTMDGFIRDYTEAINRESELMYENAELKEQIENLIFKLQELEQENHKLSKQVSELTAEIRNERTAEDDMER